MKVNDYILALGSQQLVKELKLSTNILHFCGAIIVMKGDTNYLLKDRYHDPYATVLANRQRVYDTEFKIISLSLLKKVSKYQTPSNMIMEPGENIIIEIPE